MTDNAKRCWCGDVHKVTFEKDGRKHFSAFVCLRLNKKGLR